MCFHYKKILYIIKDCWDNKDTNKNKDKNKDKNKNKNKKKNKDKKCYILTGDSSGIGARG